jgi:hypothetical protein
MCVVKQLTSQTKLLCPPKSEAMLIAFSALPVTGKTTLARELAKQEVRERAVFGHGKPLGQTGKPIVKGKILAITVSVERYSLRRTSAGGCEANSISISRQSGHPIL